MVLISFGNPSLYYFNPNLDGALIAKEITSLMGCQVGLSSDLFGTESQAKTTSGKAIQAGELYFDLIKLKTHLKNVGKVAKEGARKLQKLVLYIFSLTTNVSLSAKNAFLS